VKDYAKVATLMTRLIKKNEEWNWGQEQQQAFDRLKTLLTHAPVIRLADSSRAYVLATDASDYALGAVLMQDFGHGNQPVAYTSRQLHGAELNYPVHDEEYLADIQAAAMLLGRLDQQLTTTHSEKMGKVVELRSATKLDKPRNGCCETSGTGQATD
jgi:hypothetical protein